MAALTLRPAAHAAPAQPLRVVLLAYDSMNLLDLSGPLQALSTANRRSGKGPGTL